MATRRREAGFSDQDIADVLGQKSLEMPKHYSRSSDLARKNQVAIDVYEKEAALFGKSVKPQEKSVKLKE